MAKARALARMNRAEFNYRPSRTLLLPKPQIYKNQHIFFLLDKLTFNHF